MDELDFENMTPGEALGGLFKDMEAVFRFMGQHEEQFEATEIDPERYAIFEEVYNAFCSIFGADHVTTKLRPFFASGDIYARKPKIELTQDELGLLAAVLRKSNAPVGMTAYTNGDVSFSASVKHVYKRDDYGFSKR